MNKIVFTSLFFLVILTSCGKDLICIDGNGQVITERRQITDIADIANTTALDIVYLKADSVSLSITAESNFHGHIVTAAAGGRLEIKTEPRNACFNYRQKPVITITSPELHALDNTGSGTFDADSLISESVLISLTGSGDLHAGYINCSMLDFSLTGSGSAIINEAICHEADITSTASGNVTLSGRAENATMRVTGSGDIEALDFIAATAAETITGSGNIYTQVINTLVAVISGSGNIYLRGNPSLTQTTTGSGRVINY